MLTKFNRLLVLQILSLTIIIYLSITNVYGSNIQISAMELTGQNTSAGVNNSSNFNMISFNLSWEHSWRTGTGPANWDAAWIFVKFRVESDTLIFDNVNSIGTTFTIKRSTSVLKTGMTIRRVSGTGSFPVTYITSILNDSQFTIWDAGTLACVNATVECSRPWQHAMLNNTGHVAPTGSTISTGLLFPGTTFNSITNPGIGVFIHRSSNGTGTNIFHGVQLRWNYASQKVKDNAKISIQVFAIEMVYIPGGVNFAVGGSTGTSPFTLTTINTANASMAPSGTGSHGGQAGGFPTGQAPPNSSWPNGYNSIYCMKYELSNGQYRDFLNTLNGASQQNFLSWVLNSSPAGTYAQYSSIHRRTLKIRKSGTDYLFTPAEYGCDLDNDNIYNEANDGEAIAANGVSYVQCAAYLDWAGLRPMTTLEFEKICRGNLPVVAGEFAWGNTNIVNANNITNAGQFNESSTTANRNIAANNQPNVQGPLRVGIFAGNTTTRQQSGATYYGVMEMSGNLWEIVVSLLANGNTYTGLHGDGQLLPSGYANVPFWPAVVYPNFQISFGTDGIDLKGGSWLSTSTTHQISDRTNIQVISSLEATDNGFRGVRTAP